MTRGQTPRRWGWGIPLKKRAATRIESNVVKGGAQVNFFSRVGWGCGVHPRIALERGCVGLPTSRSRRECLT